MSYEDLKALMADYILPLMRTLLCRLWTDFLPSVTVDIQEFPSRGYENWPNLSTYFRFSHELRKLIYTTNAIEGFNHQFRKMSKPQSVFPTDDSLFNLLYPAMKDITKKRTGQRCDWRRIYAQQLIYYDNRLPEWRCTFICQEGLFPPDR